jgi:uncharacterized protein
LGLAAGIGIGALFFKGGYNLGRTQKTYPSVGWLFPLVILGLLALRIMYPQIPDQDKSGILFYSLKGPGSMYAPLAVSLVVGLAIGVVAQRSRFCTMGAFRDLFLFRQMHLLSGLIALLVAAFLTNLVLGQFNPGFVGQPVAHTMQLWNFHGHGGGGPGLCPGRGLPGTPAFYGRRR